MPSCISILVTCLLMALPQTVLANQEVLDYFQREFAGETNKSPKPKAAQSKVSAPQETNQPATGDSGSGRKSDCPPSLPDYVCEIIKFLQPLPFSYEQEQRSSFDPKARQKVKKGLLGRIEPFREHIHDASTTFLVPEALIISVINAESSGNPKAKNPKSTAKGLMQTIDGTFSMAKRALARDYGISIASPYDPRSSIMAGTWYLRHVFDWAANRNPRLDIHTARLEDWDQALMNYYLGPGHEEYLQGKLVVYPNGHIEPLNTAQKYVSKIITFAETVTG